MRGLCLIVAVGVGPLVSAWPANQLGATETRAYTYDALGRLVHSSSSSGSSEGDTVIAYDNADNRTAYISSADGPDPSAGPIAVSDSASGTAYQACFNGISKNVLENDIDPNENYPLLLISVSPSNQKFHISGQSIIYDSFPYASPGVFSATYIVQNSLGQQAAGTVTFNVTGGNISCD